ncbi:TRAP-type C4-dicarboxylate transport system, substrate-binding protein [Sulfitobacter brevis]|uniref:TRAP-type C4-dicarboxylate transport system, substrate-binding protein n=1 Tax=Sulfitobacter brevis TaxID=74348 RepID=A0A1I2BW51_9RHOB|nr:TRAP transporter substrate-binding protein DctP [Sulfitobacter brevis]SFE60234.1 TRAP-type C4-dicarboxylate transport system, substrate-binding protein [Sulfitobacter brevis]
MKHLFAGTVAAFALSALTLVASQADAAPRELRFAEFGPNAGARAGGLEWLDEEMRKRSNGELGLDIIWGGALVGAAGAAQAISDGVADMGSIVPVYAPGQLVTYEVVDTPQFPDEYVGMMATYDLMTQNPTALKEAEDFNVVYFGNYTTGPTQLLTRDKPVKSLADLEGMTIRATGAFVPAIEGFGGATVSVSQPNVYEALSNGSVDGSTTYYYVVDGYKQYEVAKYMTELNMGQTLAFGIVFNKGAYDSLTPEQQDMMNELGHDFTVRMAEIMHTSRTETKAKLAAGIDGKKVEMIDAPDDMRKAMIDLAEKDAVNWAEKANGKGLDADAVRGDFDKRVADYQAKVDSEGYPWK